MVRDRPMDTTGAYRKSSLAYSGNPSPTPYDHPSHKLPYSHIFPQTGWLTTPSQNFESKLASKIAAKYQPLCRVSYLLVSFENLFCWI